MDEPPPPTDRWRVTLGALFLLGAASLLPWNFFITANDYWMFKFRNTSVPFSPDHKHNETQLFFGAYLSITSNVVFIVFLGFNTLISKRVSSNTRIVYPLLLTVVLFVVTTCLVKVDTDQFTAARPQFFYGGAFQGQTTLLFVTLLIVALINVFVGFIMGASMGVCGYLPPRYMAYCSLGQAAGGLICCATQVICLLLNLGLQDTAFIYFSAATVMLALTLAAHLAMKKSDFFKHYSALAETDTSLPSRGHDVPYVAIFQKGWQYHLSCFLVYVVTISVFPALIVYASSTQSSSGSLLTGKLFIALACFTAFNAADCVGRYAFNWIQIGSAHKKLLLWLCASRIILVPLLLFCNIAPLNREHTQILIHSDLVFILLIVILGASNGYLISAAFVFAPKTVALELQEVSAGIASWFAAIGSAVGAVLSYGVVWLL